MKNKNLLIAVGVLVVGYLLYQKSKTNKSNNCEKEWDLKDEDSKGRIGRTRDLRKGNFMYTCVNNIKPQTIYN
jgi:hypothetical protein